MKKTPSLSRKYYRRGCFMQTLDSLCQEILRHWHPHDEYFQASYTQTKKTMNTENIPGMCVLTNHMRDLVTARKRMGSQSRN